MRVYRGATPAGVAAAYDDNVGKHERLVLKRVKTWRRAAMGRPKAHAKKLLIAAVDALTAAQKGQ